PRSGEKGSKMAKGTLRKWLVGGVCVLAAPAVPLSAAEAPPASAPATQDDPELQRLYTELGTVGEALAKTTDPTAVTMYNIQEADILVRVIVRCKPDERAQWIRQIVDCLQIATLTSPAN